jgi:Tol biopolymer transport system component
VQIFSVRPDGHDLRQLTHITGGDARLPDWSPDGRLIAFDIENDNGSSVALMNADGSNLRVLPHPPGVLDGDPSFTPDGRRLLIDSFDGVSESTWTTELDGSDRQLLAPAGGSDPGLSPDGSTLAYLGCNGQDFGNALFSTTEGGPTLQLTPFDFNVGFKLDWAPDGRRLAFTHHADLPNPGDSANLATISSHGTDLHFLTHYAGGHVNALFGSYSPDGRWIIFRLEDHGRYGLYKIRPDGTDQRAILPLSDLAPRFIDWGPRPADAGHDGGDGIEHVT